MVDNILGLWDIGLSIISSEVRLEFLYFGSFFVVDLSVISKSGFDFEI